jgi:hypothetical protein
MTKNDKMEELSRSFLEIIANITGYYPSYSKDYGVDLMLRKNIVSQDRKRYYTSAKAIDIQLKSVHKKYVSSNGPYLSYNLEVKNYNDLVERKQINGGYIPLYLFILILPNQCDEWVTVTATELIVKECLYWYEIDDNATITKNTAKKMIHIPQTNVVDLNSFDMLFSKLN